MATVLGRALESDPADESVLEAFGRGPVEFVDSWDPCPE